MSDDRSISRPRVLVLGRLAIVTMGFGPAGLALCMPAIAADLRLDYTQQGLLLSAGLLAFVIALAAAGVADRCGFRGLLVLAAAVQAGGWVWISCAGGYGALCAAAFAAGCGGALADPLLTPMVCAVYPERRAAVSNILHAGYAVGLVFTAGLVMLLQSAGVHWRGIVTTFGLLCVPYGLLALLAPLPRRAHHGAERLPLRRLLRRPAFWGLVAAMFAAGAVEMAPTNWLPTMIEAGPQRVGRHVTAAGAAMLVFGTLLGGGRLLAAGIERRIGLRRWMAAMALLCMAGLAVAAIVSGRAATAAGLCVTGFGVACFWPSLLALAGDRFPSGGASMFTVLSVAGSLGAAAAPVAVGWVADRSAGGLATGLGLLALVPLALLAAAARLTRRADCTGR